MNQRAKPSTSPTMLKDALHAVIARQESRCEEQRRRDRDTYRALILAHQTATEADAQRLLETARRLGLGLEHIEEDIDAAGRLAELQAQLDTALARVREANPGARLPVRPRDVPAELAERLQDLSRQLFFIRGFHSRIA